MQATLHATSVALNGRGLLICGRAGAGKSALALELMARGAVLVADDRTILRREGARIHMEAPQVIRGMIEARGIGLLHADCASAWLWAIVDLDRPEDARLPPIRMRNLLGVDLPLLHNCAYPHFPAAVVQYLKAGRRE